MRLYTPIVLCSVVLCCAALLRPAQAAPITYTFSGFASGTLNLVPFTNSAFAFTMTGDTDNVNLNFGPTTPSITGLPATVTVNGITGDLFAPVFVFANNSASAAGFGISSPIIDMQQALLGSYDMKAAFGPATGSLLSYDSTAIGTTAGNLVFDSVGAITSPTFAATGGVTVPEAGTVTLCLPIVAFLGATMLRRRK